MIENLSNESLRQMIYLQQRNIPLLYYLFLSRDEWSTGQRQISDRNHSQSSDVAVRKLR